MKLMRKLTLWMSVLALAFVFSPRISAETPDLFTYEIRDGEVLITGYRTRSKTEVEIPEEIEDSPVRAIGTRAFYGHSEIQKVSLPDTLQIIGSHAFDSCTELQEINFPSSVSEISDYAFFECVRLKNPEFQEGLRSIGTGAFCLSSAVESITIPASVTSIGDYAFSGINKFDIQHSAAEPSALKSVVFAQGSQLKELPKQMFQNCSNLETAMLPDSVEVIGDRAFQNCDHLKDFVFPSSLQYIGARAFSHCEALTSINTGAAFIGESAFADCYGIQELNLTGMKEVHENAFVSVGSSTEGLVLVVPSTLETVSETAFAANCFHEIICNENPRFFTDEEHFGLYERKDNGILLDAVACNQPERRQYAVFDGTTRIADRAMFSEILSIPDLSIPSSVTEIGDHSLAHILREAESLVIPGTLSSLGKGALENCGAKSVTLNYSGVLPEDLLNQASSLETLTINGTVTGLYRRCLGGADSLKWTVPSSVTAIDPQAFGLSFPSGIAFSDAFDLVDGLLYSGDHTVLYAAEPGLKKEELHLHDDTKVIRSHALSFSAFNEEAPKRIVIPAGTETIEDQAIGWLTANDSYSLQKDILILSDSDAAEAYALKNDIACADDEPAMNLDEVTLAKDETAELILTHMRTPVLFTSADPHIAMVDRTTGVVTGVSRGTTTVIAASGSRYYSVPVTVRNGKYQPDTSKENTYTMADRDGLENWENTYFKQNPAASSHTQNISALIYSGNSYVPMFGLHYLQGFDYEDYLKSEVYDKENWGHDLGVFNALNPNLDREMARGRNENLVLYSGAGDPNTFLLTGKKGTRLVDLYDSIGDVITFDCMISTTLDHSVANSFAGTQGDALLLEIYVPEGTDAGTYIRRISVNPQETEYLLRSGLRYQILDVGVRRVVCESLIHDTDPLTVDERFMKLLILEDGQEKVEDFDPYVRTMSQKSPTPTPSEAPSPTGKPDEKESSEEDDGDMPVITESAVVTCQQAGYPEGWYWDEERHACVAPSGWSGVTAATADPHASTAIRNGNGSGNTVSGTSQGTQGNEEEGKESSAPTLSPQPQFTVEAQNIPESDLELEPKPASHSLWFLGIPAAMIVAGLLLYLSRSTAMIPVIIGADALISLFFALKDHSVIGWILLVLNLLAVILLAVFRRRESQN